MKARLCPACGELARAWRPRERASVCKVCVRLTAEKFDAACDEWARITRSA